MTDPWLDPPGRARRWLPSAGDGRRMRVLRGIVLGVLVLGVAAFLLRGADQPADPALGDPVDGVVDGGEDGATVERRPFGAFGEAVVTVRTPDGAEVESCLLTATTSEQRRRGLMEVTDLQGYDGMVFVWDTDADGSFWMRNTPMPLSIAWIDAAGELVDTADMEPCGDREDCPSYQPDGSYRTAIEVPQGQLPDIGIVPGSAVTLGGACT